MLASKKTRIVLKDDSDELEQVDYRMGFNGWEGDGIFYKSEDGEFWCVDFTNADVDKSGSAGHVDGTWRIEKDSLLVARILIMDAADESELPTADMFPDEWEYWKQEDDLGWLYDKKEREWERKFERY